jgi:hypothetical protein
MMAPALRVIAVLGYSAGDSTALHPVCEARLARAAAIAAAGDVVVLSGWARAWHARSEAELMEAAWAGRGAKVIRDDGARHTVENALHATRIARSLAATEIVVVTSRWHRRRALAAFRWSARGSAVRVTAVAPEEPHDLHASLREAVLWPLLPLQLALVRRS